MLTATSTKRWRDEPLVPEGYDHQPWSPWSADNRPRYRYIKGIAKPDWRFSASSPDARSPR